MAKYNCYMQRIDKPNQPVYNIETHFPGLHYKEFKGLENFGKIKSVYTEAFAETDALQVYVHPTPVRDAIMLTLTLVFFGDDYRKVYHDFVDYISKGKISYWDDIRNRKVDFVLIDAIEPSEDNLKGTKYLQASFKLQGLSGQTIVKTI